MTIADEEEYIGEDPENAPKIDSGEYCNAKKTGRDEEGETVFTGYCNAVAGKGTDHLGEGRCKYHGGASTGAPSSNQHAQTHGLNADPHHYYQSLSPEEREFIHEVAESIEGRIRENGNEVDSTDRMLARKVGILLHIVSRASKYVQEESGLVQEAERKGVIREEQAPLLAEIRRYDDTIMRLLKKLGVLVGPERATAEAIDTWREFIDESEESRDT